MSAAICKWILCQPPRQASIAGGIGMVDALINERDNLPEDVPESVFVEANKIADQMAELGDKLKALCMPFVP